MSNSYPILITGIPRSGTSMIAAAINKCGAFGGEMSKRGMYSNDQIRESLVKPYLNRMGIDTEGHYPLLRSISIPRDWDERVEKVLEVQGYEDGPWMYKDSRITPMWRVWNRAYKNARWVIVRRKPLDVIHSCIQTAYMLRFKSETVQKYVGVNTEKDGWWWMIHQYEAYFNEMVQEGIHFKEIWPERMATGDYSQMYELCDWLGLKWSDAALDYINPLLWGNKIRERR